MPLPYRPELDGLRAVAVLGVVLYHLGVGGFGFVGVDVFFVISGYLITALLLREHADRGSIDLMAFYARRVRRILPAAMVLIIATVALSTLLAPPIEWGVTCDSAVASALYVGNIFLLKVSSGYFMPQTQELPLLHLWSLSVEEQFYLLWPATLLAILRWRPRWLLPALAVAGALSFVGSEWILRHWTDLAYFMMPTRIWELAAGAMIAAGAAKFLRSPAFAWAGLAMVVAACAWQYRGVPGIGALPAVLGASFVIAAVHNGARNPLLASRPFVAIGLVSYSLYLWHWPLLALHRTITVGEESAAARWGLCALALLLAAASYRWVEQPFRRLRMPSWKMVFGGVVASIALAEAIFAFSLRPRLEPHPAAAHAENDRPSDRCHVSMVKPAMLKCQASARTRMGIWGDSMAYSWMPMVQAKDPYAVAFTRDGCGPFLGLRRDSLEWLKQACAQTNDLAVEKVAGLQELYLSALWLDDPQRDAALDLTLQKVSPQVGRIVIIGPSPDLKAQVGRCLRYSDLTDCTLTRAEFDAHAAPILRHLRAIAAKFPNVTVLDPTAFFCSTSTCPAMRDGYPLYWDSHHVSTTAARNFSRGYTGAVPPEPSP